MARNDCNANGKTSINNNNNNNGSTNVFDISSSKSRNNFLQQNNFGRHLNNQYVTPHTRSVRIHYFFLIFVFFFLLFLM